MVRRHNQGLKLTLRHSKTDLEWVGRVIAVPSGKMLRPVERLQPWLAVRRGPAVFSDRPAGAADRQAHVGPFYRAADPEICGLRGARS